MIIILLITIILLAWLKSSHFIIVTTTIGPSGIYPSYHQHHTVWRINGVFRQLAEQFDRRPEGLKRQQKLNYHLNTDDLDVMKMILVMIKNKNKNFYCLSCLSNRWKFPKFVTYSRYGRETSLTKCPPESWTYSVRCRVATPWSRGDFEFFQTSPLTKPVWMELFESYLDFGENMISIYNI